MGKILSKQNEEAWARVEQRLGQNQLRRAAIIPNFNVSGSSVNGVTFEVVQGDITDELSDAIVNPTDDQFRLGSPLSKAIVSAGGDALKHECEKLGTLSDEGAITSAGNGKLRCKHVVHVLSPRALPECQRATLAAVRLVCFKRLKSIALPLIGGGAQPRDQVASAITEALVTAAREGACGRLKRVRLVGYSAADRTAFDDALRQSIAVPNPGINPPSLFAHSASVPNIMHAVAAPPLQPPLHFTPPPSPRAPVWSRQVTPPPASMPLTSPASNTTYTSKCVAGVSIEVVEGDITNESADAIVNPTDANLQLSGNLSQAIVAKDPSIVHECSALGTMTSAAFTNAGGSLLCTYVLHVLFPSSLQECEQVLRAALRLADQQAILSLSIPPIGAGAAGLPLQQAADTIADTIVREARGGNIGSITRVRFVGFNQRERQAFETALTNALSGNARGSQAPLGFTPNAARNFTPRGNFRARDPRPFSPPAASRTSSKTINGVTIEVTQSNITDEATDAIVNPTNASFALDGGLSKAITSNGGPTIEQECRQRGTLTTAGAITSGGQLQCTHVIHVLSPSDLNECQTAVQAALTLASQYSLQSISLPPIGGGGRGLPCDQIATCIASEVVNSARANSLGLLTLVRLVAFNTNEYTAFDNALQQAVSGRGAMFPMKQAAKQGLQNKPVSPSGQLPASWAPMTTNKPSQQVEMRQTDSDYSDAKKLFTLSGSTLHRMFRIQNPSLYAQFEVEKTKMDNLYAGQWRYKSSIEWTLYHGTDSGTLAKINGNGFDRSYCGKNATWFGLGSYFARDMGYSAQARYSPPDGMGHKWIYAARVLVGLYCQGTKDMQHPPNQPNGYPYDTAVDRTTTPSIFVIFRDIRAYPLYLYEFS